MLSLGTFFLLFWYFWKQLGCFKITFDDLSFYVSLDTGAGLITAWFVIVVLFWPVYTALPYIGLLTRLFWVRVPTAPKFPLLLQTTLSHRWELP